MENTTSRPAVQEEMELSSLNTKHRLDKRDDMIPSEASREEVVMASMTPATDGDGEIITNEQVLAPIDGGKAAWTFCFCAFVLETIVWGFGFR